MLATEVKVVTTLVNMVDVNGITWNKTSEKHMCSKTKSQRRINL
jgi:hypothetical protein